MSNENVDDRKIALDLSTIQYAIGSTLTDEQKEFVSDFTKNTISFSDAGTGKTHSLIAGIALAQKSYGIRGSKICCMSFTNAAVNEISARYDKFYKKCNVGTKPVFSTVHALFLKILKDAYPQIEVVNLDFVKCKSMLESYMKETGLKTDDWKLTKSIFQAIQKLNSALYFDDITLSNSYDFIKLGINSEDFNYIRERMFRAGIITNKIAQGDIPLYCLYALHNNSDIIDKWKSKYDIMIVDEFQDLSTLQLEILSYISNTMVVIGDMKQQIYAFNGASDLIVDKFLECKNNDVRICNLTKSFRCRNEIAEFARKIIEPNMLGEELNFTGTKDGGSVEIIARKNMDWKGIANSIYTDISVNGFTKAKDIMFLYRNNVSALPIIDELYNKRIAFRCSRFVRAYEVPIVKDLYKLARVARDPYNQNNITDALKLFDEFSNTNYGKTLPPIQVMEKTGKSIIDVPYGWKTNEVVAYIKNLKLAQEDMKNGKSTGSILNRFWRIYEKAIIKEQWWRLDNTPEFYLNLVAPIVNSRTFDEFVRIEDDKATRNDNYLATSVGIRCYTIHSAKGLEADYVYLLDADEGMFPNKSTMKSKAGAGCDLDVAKDIRSDRNLLFVAITRAKEKLVISYSSELCKLIADPYDSNYSKYDKIYADQSRDAVGDDVSAFFNIFNVERGNNG